MASQFCFCLHSITSEVGIFKYDHWLLFWWLLNYQHYVLNLFFYWIVYLVFLIYTNCIGYVNQFSSVTQSCPTLCDPMNHSTPGLPVHHQLLEFTRTHIHRISDAIQPSHPLSSPSPLAPNPSQHQSFPMSQLFAWGGQSTGVSSLASFLPKRLY